MRLKMLRLMAALSAALLTACSSTEERQRAVWMDQVEQRIRLPKGSRPLNEYARYYATDEQDRIVGIYTTFVERDIEAMNLPPGKRRWVGDALKLPGISDGGCGVVNVVYNPKSGIVEEAFCNGVA